MHKHVQAFSVEFAEGLSFDHATPSSQYTYPHLRECLPQYRYRHRSGRNQASHALAAWSYQLPAQCSSLCSCRSMANPFCRPIPRNQMVAPFNLELSLRKSNMTSPTSRLGSGIQGAKSPPLYYLDIIETAANMLLEPM